MNDDDLIRRGDVLALPPYDGDGDPAGQWDHHVFVRRDAIAALPAMPFDAMTVERAALVAESFSTQAHVAYSIKTGVFPEQPDIREAIADAIRALAPEPAHVTAARVLLADPSVLADISITMVRANKLKDGKRIGYGPSLVAALRAIVEARHD